MVHTEEKKRGEKNFKFFKHMHCPKVAVKQSNIKIVYFTLQKKENVNLGKTTPQNNKSSQRKSKRNFQVSGPGCF